MDGLGPEPLETSRAAFAGRYRGRKGRIKSLLLDQRVVAGIGNIYADEILFRARIHPLTPAAALDDAMLGTLWRSTRAVLRRAIDRKGSTIRDFTDPDGEPGDFQSLHKVYGREREACLACGTAGPAHPGRRKEHLLLPELPAQAPAPPVFSASPPFDKGGQREIFRVRINPPRPPFRKGGKSRPSRSLIRSLAPKPRVFKSG